MKEAIFATFALFTIASSLGVVLSRSPVYSAFSLILSFFGLSAVYVMWGSVFVGMIQILVYTGAIVVLFVFVVMLLNLGRGTVPHTNGLITILLATAGVWFISAILLFAVNHATVASGFIPDPLQDMKRISLLLFREYLWPFEVLSLFLLALIVAIYALARPEEPEKEGT